MDRLFPQKKSGAKGGGLRPVLACFLRDLAYQLTIATATDIARLFVEGGSLDIASQSFFLAGLLKPFK